jgi:peptidoglycan/xylan/chitin deacetylase (PgdA/CDA1 family)
MTGLVRALRGRLSPFSPKPRLHQWLCRRPMRLDLAAPIASFTFDDFPRSAFVNGGPILERFGARGTYYATLGWMGTEHHYGPLFTQDDLGPLLAKGHELGGHTFSHLSARHASLRAIEDDIRKNRRRAEELLPGLPLRNFSYPGGEVSLRLKRRMRLYAASSRGTYVGVNRHWVDLDLLLCQNLFETEPLDRVKQTVEQCRAQPGWLVFYGHEVSDRPTRYGCTPGYLEAVLEIVAQACRIMTVAEALAFIAQCPPPSAPRHGPG